MAAWIIFGFTTLPTTPTFSLIHLVWSIPTVANCINDTVHQYILRAAGNIAVMGKLKNGKNLLTSIDKDNYLKYLIKGTINAIVTFCLLRFGEYTIESDITQAEITGMMKYGSYELKSFIHQNPSVCIWV
jgi:hypothetical protein